MSSRTTRSDTLNARAALSECRAELEQTRQELRRLRAALASLRTEERELRAYARATVAADLRGEPGAGLILAGLLEERGQLPAPEALPSALLAEAYKEGVGR